MSAADAAEGGTPITVLVLADTHIRDGGSRRLPEEVWAAARRADVILHAGDVLSAGLLDELGAVAPLYAVLGNNDVDLVGILPETLELQLAGVHVAMIHDSSARTGRGRRMHRRFPDADVVVYGHSHLPDDSVEVAGQRLFNPGSCVERRRAPARTYGVLRLGSGVVLEHRIVALDPQ